MIKVTHVSHSSSYTPPAGYGGTELIVHLLAKYQSIQGLRVKVIGVKNPRIAVPYAIYSPFKKPIPIRKFGTLHKLYYSSYSLLRSLGADVIHLHIQSVIPALALLKALKTPILLTLHADPRRGNIVSWILKHFKVPLVAISKSQRDRLTKYFYIVDIIYHGIEIQRYNFNKEKEDYLIYVGAIHPSKGPHIAVKVAKRLGEKLILIGPVMEPDYFDMLIRPYIDGEQIVYLGEVDFDTKVLYLSKAKALLFPVQYEEYFGLVMVEALACGTPVVGFNKGSVPEIVENESTGYVVSNIEGMIQAIRRIDMINPASCRHRAERLFSAERMAREYVELYERLLDIKLVRV